MDQGKKYFSDAKGIRLIRSDGKEFIDVVSGTFNTAVHLINAKKIPADKIITHVYNIAEYRKAFSMLGVDFENKKMVQRAQGLKVIIKPK